MTNFKQLKDLLIYGWNIELRTENWKVWFLVLQRYQLKMVADAKRRRSNFMMYVKESLSVNSSMF